MRNIVSVDVTKTPYSLSYANEGTSSNEIILSFIIGNLTNPYIEITNQSSTISNTDILPIKNHMVEYSLPISSVYTSGSILVRLRANNYNSNYITLNIPSTLKSSNNIIVKIDDDDYVIRKVGVVTSKQYSKEETFTGMYWVDGKPIYRKVYCYDSITFTSGEHTLNIDLPNLDCVTGFKYSMWYPTLSRWYVNWDTIDAHNTTITSTICKIGSGGGNTTFTRASFVFEYTKTTD